MTEDTYKPMGTAEFSATCSALGLDADWVARRLKVDSGTVLNWFDGYGVTPEKVGRSIRGISGEFNDMEENAIRHVNESDAKKLIINRKSAGRYPRSFYRILAYHTSMVTGAEIVWEGDGR